MSLKSLIVCADLQAVQVLTGLLNDLGIGTELSDRVSSATDRLTSSRFDVVVIDCTGLPGAIQLVTGLRERGENRSALAIGLVDGTTDVKGVFTAGANFVIYKPISAERASASLRAARGLMHREKRRSRRVRLHAQASIAYANVENAPATLLDLSEEGAAIQSDRRLPPRCKVYFQFNLPGQVSTVRLAGEVTWQDSAGRVGVRFAHVPQTSRRVLTDWIKQSIGDGEPQAAPGPKSIANPRGGLGYGLLAVSAPDRRDKARLACRMSADVYRLGTNVPYRCSLTDISVGGCYVETTEPFPAATPVEIVVRTAALKIRVHGVVQSVHPGFGMGVEFSLKNSDERAQVKQLIACQSEAGLSV